MTTIFISYSHQDETPWKEFVVSHLKVAERQGVFDIWDDRRVKGGGDWQGEIDAALAQADIAVLLISRHFLTSDFILDHEVQTMLRRHASRDLALYPILISDCTWDDVVWLKVLNIRPRDGTPLNGFDEAERDQVMTGMASEIGRMLHLGQAQEAVGANRNSARSETGRRRYANGQRGFLEAWRSASIATRATVLGAVFVGLALISAILMKGNDITVTNGNFVGGGMQDSQVEISK